MENMTGSALTTSASAFSTGAGTFSTEAEKLMPEIAAMNDEQAGQCFAENEIEEIQFANLMNLDIEKANSMYKENISCIEMCKNGIYGLFEDIKRYRAENRFLKKHYGIDKKDEKIVDVSDIRPFESREIFYKFVNYVKVRDLSLSIYCIIGVTYGRRHSDIVNLKLKKTIEYIEQQKEKLKEGKSSVMKTRDQKTRDPNFIEFEDMHIRIVEHYISKAFDFEYDEKTPLIIDLKTKKGFIYNTTLDRMKRYAKEIGLNPDHIGLHTLRKSFGYFMYLDGKSLAEIMKALNQKSEEVTARYIGLTPEQVRKNKIANLPGLANFVDD